MKQDLELKLQAWLDGELPTAEARAIGREVAADAEAGRLVAELQAVKSALAGNEMPVVLPESREFYWSKIQRQIERETAAQRGTPARRVARWRYWLSPLAGFAALACMMIMATRPDVAPSFDEISSTAEGMEAVTFHDQSTGVTVVWLADSSDQSQPAQAPDAAAPPTTSQDSGDPDVEME